jgi:hypothetical protein
VGGWGYILGENDIFMSVIVDGDIIENIKYNIFISVMVGGILGITY